MSCWKRTTDWQSLFCRLNIGHDAVVVFFVLSGYLVGGAVLRIDMASSRNLWEYGIDRGVRIGPILIAASVFRFFFNI